MTTLEVIVLNELKLKCFNACIFSVDKVTKLFPSFFTRARFLKGWETAIRDIILKFLIFITPVSEFPQLSMHGNAGDIVSSSGCLSEPERSDVLEMYDMIECKACSEKTHER